ncbi:DNA/RNA-binding protein Alba 4, putative [Plasmodium chabaudi adami]|uniref:DNA/RNA-binding protein Alba 4, putative n=1 Tax=Plasmodium chabaudi adami TaxID=5826 RepID=A0A1D3LMP5_PLACE|nr:DNA/RNA-binding protein Alba 4, putative [Plasmodium chabaudi adami]
MENNKKNNQKQNSIDETEFPNSKVLLVSVKRTRRFLERTARELLAGGTRYIILSGLGDALPLCVQLQASLQSKNAATVVKIETSYSYFNTNYSYTPGLKIYMEKHPDFKGSRISPGYVSFCDKPDKFTPIFDESPGEYMCSVNAGDNNLHVGGEGINGAFSELLSSHGHEVDNYESLFKDLLSKAVKENTDKPDDEVKSVLYESVEKKYPDVKLALCRVRNSLKKGSDYTTGSVFIVTFKKKFPHKKEKNMGMVYVVGPKGKNFSSVEDFLDAVHETAENLMTALCDYNGLVKREEIKHVRMNTCRICLFSGQAFKHSNASKLDVAKYILNGLAVGYRHGPSPRLNFAYDENVFKDAWIETTGLQVFNHNEKEQ